MRTRTSGSSKIGYGKVGYSKTWLQMGVLGISVAFLLAAASASKAHAGREESLCGGAKGKDGRSDGLRQEIMEQITTIRREKLTRALELDETSAAKLFPTLARFDGQEHELARSRFDIYRELRSAVDAPKKDPGRVEALIERMSSLHVRRIALEEERVQAVRKVLPPMQMARFVLMYPRIEDEIRAHIRQLVDKARGPGRPGEDHHRGPGGPSKN